MYDRSALLAAAHGRGDHRAADVAVRLHLPRNTAWRLWHGTTAPSASTAALVETHYGITTAQLITPASTKAEGSA